MGKLALLTSVLLVFCNSSLAQDCSHSDGNFRCVDFIRNSDGDTIVVDIPRVHAFFGEHIAVRVRGIDTAEIKNRSGKTVCELEMAILAKDEVEKVFSRSEDLELRDVQRGKYFRVVADVFVNGRSLSNHLIKKGLAVPYDGGTKADVDWCKLKEQAEELRKSPNL